MSEPLIPAFTTARQAMISRSWASMMKAPRTTSPFQQVNPNPSLHQRGLELGRERHARRVSSRALDRGRDEPVQPHVLDRGRVGLVVAGERDEIADERGQLLELGDEVCP